MLCRPHASWGHTWAALSPPPGPARNPSPNGTCAWDCSGGVGGGAAAVDAALLLDDWVGAVGVAVGADDVVLAT